MTPPGTRRAIGRSNTSPFETCAYCDERFDRGVSYPAVVHDPVDGEPSLLSFCDARCETAWQSEHV